MAKVVIIYDYVKIINGFRFCGWGKWHEKSVELTLA